MLTIRMQRGGRSGHPQYRVIVQDSRFSPLSGRVVAQVGTYDPHTKATTLDSATIEKYISNGAQPSDRVASLLRTSGMKLPSWVKDPRTRNSAIRNVGKLKRNTPDAPAPEAEAEVIVPDVAADETAVASDEVVAESNVEAEVISSDVAEEASTEPVEAEAEVVEATGPAVEVVEESSEEDEPTESSDEAAKA